MSLINHCCDELGVPPHIYLPEMLTVNATDEESCKSVRQSIIKLIEANKKRFTVQIPVRFILLRNVLYSTSKMYMSRKELISYAKKCKCKEDEVEHFLEIFRQCASIISSSIPGEFLYQYVIILPIEFFHHLDKLYNLNDDQDLPQDLKKHVAFGIVQEELVRSLWQGTADSSIADHEFLVSALKSVRLIMEAGEKYFVPSLRAKLDSDPMSPGSLVITSNLSLTPFSGKQYMFVMELLSLHDEIMLDEGCPYYNVISLIWKSIEEEIKIRIRFFSYQIDVSIIPIGTQKIFDGLFFHLHSILKTDCVTIMNKIRDQRVRYQAQNYRFSIVCPYYHEHLIPFEIAETTVESLTCHKCGYECRNGADLIWVKSAYRGSYKSTLNMDDMITPQNLLNISELLSSLGIREVEELNRKLNFPKVDYYSVTSISERLIQVLNAWYSRNPNATRRKLAKILLKCNFSMQAFALDPSLFFQMDAVNPDSIASWSEEDTEFSAQELTYIAESWTQSTDELADLLSGEGQESNYEILKGWLKKQEGNKKEKLAEEFASKGYPNMASLVFDMQLY